MAREKRGYLMVGKRERDVIGCGHCRHQIVLDPGRDAARLDRCGACSSTICRRCAAELARTMKCEPFEKRIETIERRDALTRAAGG